MYVFLCDNCGESAGPADPELEQGMSGCVTLWKQGDARSERHELCRACYAAALAAIREALGRAKAVREKGH